MKHFDKEYIFFNYNIQIQLILIKEVLKNVLGEKINLEYFFLIIKVTHPCHLTRASDIMDIRAIISLPFIICFHVFKRHMGKIMREKL